MSKIFAYLRASTKKQDLDQQRLQILDYARTHRFILMSYCNKI